MKAQWKKSDYPEKKNGLKVYSCFACGGGSTMGYKLAGYDVIGANDIDKSMAKIYQTNHNPKFYHLMDIRELIEKKDLPDEMFELDILDGSPPCSSFSMSGSREKKWGEKKKFREGQKEQVLDDLFFEFIALAKRLQPKVVVAENVKGMLAGNAKKYVVAIFEAFEKAGYDAQLFLLNAATMGVPQRRERVFFIARRKDLKLPKIEFDFNEKPVNFGEIRTDTGLQPSIKPESRTGKIWSMRKPIDKHFSDIMQRVYGRDSFFNHILVSNNRVMATIASASTFYLQDIPHHVASNDLITVQTFPQDFDFIKNSYSNIKYVLGMSVPPLMTARIAQEIDKQILSKVKKR